MCLWSRVFQAKQSKGGEFCRRILWLPALWVWQRCRQCQLLRPAVTPSRAQGCACDTEPGHGFKGCAEHLHSCLQCQHLEQTHPDHTSVTERPLVHLGLSSGWKVIIVQLHLKAVTLQCLTATYIYIYMYVYRYYSFLNSETLCPDRALNASWLLAAITSPVDLGCTRIYSQCEKYIQCCLWRTCSSQHASWEQKEGAGCRQRESKQLVQRPTHSCTAHLSCSNRAANFLAEVVSKKLSKIVLHSCLWQSRKI